jgi:hypothetical protein
MSIVIYIQKWFQGSWNGSTLLSGKEGWISSTSKSEDMHSQKSVISTETRQILELMSSGGERSLGSKIYTVFQ